MPCNLLENAILLQRSVKLKVKVNVVPFNKQGYMKLYLNIYLKHYDKETHFILEMQT